MGLTDMKHRNSVIIQVISASKIRIVVTMNDSICGGCEIMIRRKLKKMQEERVHFSTTSCGYFSMEIGQDTRRKALAAVR